MIKKISPAAIFILALLCGCMELPPPEATIKPPVVAATSNASPVQQIVKQLEPGSKPLIPPNALETVQWQDIDRDGEKEALIIYELMTADRQKQLKAAVFREQNNTWQPLWDIVGPGLTLEYAGFADVAGNKAPELLLGWSLGASAGNGLDVYTWQEDRMKLLGSLNYDMNLVVEDMPAENEKDGKAEIALWHEEAPDVHRIEVVRWKIDGFVPAEDVYPYYFQKVIRHYAGLIETPDMKQHPYIGAMWYYLADAQMKVQTPNEALLSIQRGKRDSLGYPSEDQFALLERQVRESPAYFSNNKVMGISQSDAIDLFGDKYVSVTEQAGQEIWRYDIGMQSDYRFSNNYSGLDVDMEAINAGKIKVQFFIYWNEQKHADRYDIWYFDPNVRGALGSYGNLKVTGQR